MQSEDMVEAAPRRIAVDNRFDYERDVEEPMDEEPSPIGSDPMGEREEVYERPLQPQLTSDQILELLSSPSNREHGAVVGYDEPNMENEYIGDRPENMNGGSGMSAGRVYDGETEDIG